MSDEIIILPFENKSVSQSSQQEFLNVTENWYIARLCYFNMIYRTNYLELLKFFSNKGSLSLCDSTIPKSCQQRKWIQWLMYSITFQWFLKITYFGSTMSSMTTLFALWIWNSTAAGVMLKLDCRSLMLELINICLSKISIKIFHISNKQCIALYTTSLVSK